MKLGLWRDVPRLAVKARALQSPEPSTDATVEFANKALELQKLATESTKERQTRKRKVVAGSSKIGI
eukprot:5163761-Amphidinium_carterae.1